MRRLSALLLWFGVTQIQALTYEGLRELIESQRLTRIEDVIPQLPPEFHEHYTLMHTSRSLQGASPTAPRGILFGKDAKLVISFGGDPQLNGFDTLEVIQFRADRREFEFRQIRFPEGDTTKTVDFSPANPSLCMGCHTNRLRPNWERYPEWPGAYGSADDNPTNEELTNLKTFNEKHSSGPRYRSLKRLPGSDASPYETQRRGRLRFRPNFRLGSALFAYQADALAASLQTHPRYQKIRPLFAMSRLACKEMPETLKVNLVEMFGETAVQPLAKWTEPTPRNVFAFLLRAVGFSPKKFSTELVVPPDVEPYFFHGGIPKDFEEPYENGVLELTDLVMNRMLRHLAETNLEIKEHLAEFRWIERRFKNDPLDAELAGSMDDIMRFHNHVKLKGACGALAREYQKSFW